MAKFIFRLSAKTVFNPLQFRDYFTLCEGTSISMVFS